MHIMLFLEKKSKKFWELVWKNNVDYNAASTISIKTETLPTFSRFRSLCMHTSVSQVQEMGVFLGIGAYRHRSILPPGAVGASENTIQSVLVFDS